MSNLNDLPILIPEEGSKPKNIFGFKKKNFNKNVRVDLSEKEVWIPKTGTRPNGPIDYVPYQGFNKNIFSKLFRIFSLISVISYILALFPYLRSIKNTPNIDLGLVSFICLFFSVTTLIFGILGKEKTKFLYLLNTIIWLFNFILQIWN